MTRKDRLRRVVILCSAFARNLAYYRAGHGKLTNGSPQFWITVDGNFIDMSVLDWCKLFADHNGNHSWKKIVTDPHRFEQELLGNLSVTSDELRDYVDEMRTYRNKFLAHLDDLPVMNIPLLDRAKATVEFYHRYIVYNEATTGDLAGLPCHLAHYYGHALREAGKIYNAQMG